MEHGREKLGDFTKVQSQQKKESNNLLKDDINGGRRTFGIEKLAMGSTKLQIVGSHKDIIIMLSLLRSDSELECSENLMEKE